MARIRPYRSVLAAISEGIRLYRLPFPPESAGFGVNRAELKKKKKKRGKSARLTPRRGESSVGVAALEPHPCFLDYDILNVCVVQMCTESYIMSILSRSRLYNRLRVLVMTDVLNYRVNKINTYQLITIEPWSSSPSPLPRGWTLWF